MTGDREQARDLLQSCVARASAARRQPRDDDAFRAWLFKIMRNLWIDQVRAQKRNAALFDDYAEDVFGMPVSLESMVVNAFAVRQAFEALSHDHREVLALIDISGFTYQEAAELLAVPAGTIMSRVSRARQNLANLLSDEEPNVIPLPRNSRLP